jgi:hypothetical protein
MPTFPIYAGISQFEVVEKMNPDIPIGIAKLLRNPDFLKISPFKTSNPEFYILRHFIHVSQSEIGKVVRHCLFTCVACREQVRLSRAI